MDVVPLQAQMVHHPKPIFAYRGSRATESVVQQQRDARPVRPNLEYVPVLLLAVLEAFGKLERLPRGAAEIHTNGRAPHVGPGADGERSLGRLGHSSVLIQPSLTDLSPPRSCASPRHTANAICLCAVSADQASSSKVTLQTPLSQLEVAFHPSGAG